MIHALAERHAHPSNPVARGSRAVVTFHVANRHFPDGDADRIRALENVRVPWTVVEDRFPRFNPGDQPLLVKEKIAREIVVNSWFQNDKTIDSNDPAVHVAACSVKNNSFSGTGDAIDRIKKARMKMRCNGSFDACTDRALKGYLTIYPTGLTKIPSCLGERRGNKVKSLDLSGMKISKIDSLDKFTRLETLHLGSNDIEKIEGLDALARLKILTLDGKITNGKIRKIEGLDTLTNLTGLSLTHNIISKIEGLDKLPKLSWLRLGNNQITEIGGIGTLSKLNWLLLNENKIRKIQGLDTLANLITLNLSDNQIEKIENLDALKNLETIELDGNDIEKIEGLDALSKLEFASIGNNIETIEGLDALGKLESLHLASNNINKIENLERLTGLKELNLKKNQIRKIEGLDTLSKLSSIWLEGNVGLPADACQSFNENRSLNGMPVTSCYQ